ncbi:MAG: hypothetical protein L6Q54_09205 [Leptospiraceae bacterium]|nr:hypothetical protein [Leptospiraceae bacterium]
MADKKQEKLKNSFTDAENLQTEESEDLDLDLSLDDFPDIENNGENKEISYDDIDQMLSDDSGNKNDDSGLEPPSLDDLTTIPENSDFGDELSNLVASSVDDSIDSEDFEDSYNTIDEDRDSFEFGSNLEDENLDLDLSDSNDDFSNTSAFDEDFDLDLDEAIPLVDDELNQILESDDISLDKEKEIPSKKTTDSFKTNSSILNSEDDDEPIALSPDELAHITEDESLTKEESEDIFDTDSFGEPDEDEEIALSGEELDNILGGDETEEPSILNSEDDDEPIALSPDELAHITGDESLTKEESEDIFGESDEDGEVDLSDDELGRVLESDEPILSSSFEDEGDDEPIALSPDELAHITEDESVTKEESEDIFDTDSFGEPDEDGEIALSDDELDHILESDEPILQSPPDSGSDLGKDEYAEIEDDSITMPLDELGHILETDSTESDLDNSVNLSEDIALSDNELSNILESDSSIDRENKIEPLGEPELNEIIGDISAEDTLEAKSKIVDEAEHSEADSLVIDLDEYAEEGNLSPLEELHGYSADKEIENIQREKESVGLQDKSENLSREEMQKMLSYLDNLLGNLPENVIAEFSKSDYFSLYKKIMNDLGL